MILAKNPYWSNRRTGHLKIIDLFLTNSHLIIIIFVYSTKNKHIFSFKLFQIIICQQHISHKDHGLIIITTILIVNGTTNVRWRIRWRRVTTTCVRIPRIANTPDGRIIMTESATISARLESRINRRVRVVRRRTQARVAAVQTRVSQAVWTVTATTVTDGGSSNNTRIISTIISAIVSAIISACCVIVVTATQSCACLNVSN